MNLENREKQLFKPLLRVFQRTETIHELLPVISKYVSQKRESNANSYHAFLYRTIKDLITATDSTVLDSGLIFTRISEDLGCDTIPGKPQTLLSQEFGELSQKAIVQTLKDVFGATKSKRHGEGRKLLFEKTKLDRLGRMYELSIDVQVVEGEQNENGTLGTLGTLIGIEKHLYKTSSVAVNSVSAQDSNENYEFEETKRSTKQKEEEGNSDPFSENASHVSHVSQTSEGPN